MMLSCNVWQDNEPNVQTVHLHTAQGDKFGGRQIKTTSYYLPRLLISQYNVWVKLSVHFFALPPHYTGCDQNHLPSRSLPPPPRLLCCDVMMYSCYAQLIGQAGHGTLSSVASAKASVHLLS